MGEAYLNTEDCQFFFELTGTNISDYSLAIRKYKKRVDKAVMYIQTKKNIPYDYSEDIRIKAEKIVKNKKLSIDNNTNKM